MTPTYFIDDLRVEGYRPSGQFRMLVDGELARAAAARESAIRHRGRLRLRVGARVSSAEPDHCDAKHDRSGETMTPAGAEGRGENPLTRVEVVQQRQLVALLRHVWAHSEFYREYYAGHGIRSGDLAHLTVRDLPFLTKQTLMEHFDSAVTDARLRKRGIERWFEDHSDPRAVFHEDFVALSSTGSSGVVGIFAYDRVGWRAVNSVASTRLPGPPPGKVGKTRVAFYISAYRHSAAVTTSLFMAPALHDILVLSILDPPEHVVGQLHAFQPHRVVGYSSAVTTLADWTMGGRGGPGRGHCRGSARGAGARGSRADTRRRG